MNSLLDIHQDFLSANSVDALWQKLHTYLNQYSIVSVFYLVTHSAKQLIEEGAEAASYFNCSHPDAYREYFDEQFLLEDDPTAMHCMVAVTPFFWHDNSRLAHATDTQKTFMEESENLMGLNVGLTLPLRFGLSGGGGMGLCADNSVSANEFEKIWASHSQQIIHICYTYDEVLRRQFPQAVIAQLSPQEREVLLRLAQGKKSQAIAAALTVSEHTVGSYLSRARNKLKARNNTQALIKAVEFGLISV
jgi:DNA-binding CsgD family transcriptional regulator